MLRISHEEFARAADYELTARERREVRRLLEERLRSRRPLAYLIREAWLGDHRFYVDERVVVPRSFIAELLRERLRPWVSGPVHRALDLCTGSGCLAILLALTFPRAAIDASDISRPALAVARKNLEAYRLRRRIKLVRADLFSGIERKQYDLIVANPPYVGATAMRKLPPEYQREPRLALAGGPDGLTFVRRILFTGARATGAEITSARKTEIVQGRELILTCGAIHSPAVLMRSGVGAPDELAKHGVGVVAALPGVGRNLIEHPSVSVSCYLGREGRLHNLERHHTQAQVRFSSRLPGCPTGDMCLAVLARSGWHALGQRVGSLYFFVNKAYSQGSVTLRSADPGDEPLVDFRMLSDRRDLERMRNAFRFVAEIAAAPELDAIRTKIFPANYSDRMRKVSRPGLQNTLQMSVFAGILDTMPMLRSWLIDTLVTSGTTLADVLADDATLEAYLQKSVNGVWHPVGSCRMGRDGDPLAVTTPSGRVRGVDGLRVSDASVMPSIPCANTNISTIMVAERMADLIKGEAAAT